MSKKRVLLSYQNLSEIPAGFAETCGTEIEELDLTHNCISDLRFLCDFPCLTTLILDHNKIHSHVKMHEILSLSTLWLNHNAVKNLSTFITTLARSCPNLRFLSMMSNDAAPSYFNGGTIQQFLDYRQYVISYLPKLEVLDDQKVTPGERLESERIYGLRINVHRKDGRSKSKRKSSSSNLIEDASRHIPGRRSKQQQPEHRVSLTEKPVMERSSVSPVQSGKKAPRESTASIAAEKPGEHQSDSEQFHMVEDPQPPTLTDTLMLELASALKDKLNPDIREDEDDNKENIHDKNVETISNENLISPSSLRHMYERQTSNKDPQICTALPTIPVLPDPNDNSELSSDTDSMGGSSITDSSLNDNVPMTTNLDMTNLQDFSVKTNHTKKEFPIEKASHFKTLPDPQEKVTEKDLDRKPCSGKVHHSLSQSDKQAELSSSFSDNEDWEDDKTHENFNNQLSNCKNKTDTSSFGTVGSNDNTVKIAVPPIVAPKPKHIVKTQHSDDSWDESDDDEDWDDDVDNSPDKNRIQTQKSVAINPDIHSPAKFDNVEGISENVNVKVPAPAVAPKPKQPVRVDKGSSDWSASDG